MEREAITQHCEHKVLDTAAPGLDLVYRALRRTSADDDEAIRRGQFLYDALYAELSAGENRAV